MLALLFIIAAIPPLLMTKPHGTPAPCGFRAGGNYSTVSTALELYKLDNYVYPSTQQGLQALLEKPSREPIPANWQQGGYHKAISIDSWKHRFIYQSDTKDFKLVWLGEDGKLGGDNCNRDV